MICARPTLYEAQKWLREKHQIIINVKPYDTIRLITDQCNNMWYRYHIFPNRYGFADTRFHKVFNEGILEALKMI